MVHIRTILLLCFLLHHFHDITCNNVTDKEALLSFKFQVTDPNNTLSGWLEDSNHCSFGITCSKVGNRVQSLNLKGLGLSGRLPSKISNLTYLHSLNLSNNTFHGQVPSSFGNFKFLKSLDLARNMFEGEIPSELGNLRNLSLLQLSVNNFTGQFPTSIFNISSLSFLSVTANNLSGKLPPNFGHALPNLVILALATNNFEGVIPNSISNASQLSFIDLSNNKFHGQIPLLHNLKNLTGLHLGNNYLSSTTSLNFQFFNSLGNSTELQIIMINDNNLAGELPSSLENLSSHLQQFCVADNWLKGRIPQGWNKFQDLISFSFENNSFTGELPSEIGALKRLERLVIYNNRLSGEIPDIFGNFTNLYTLAMRNNHFSGRIHSSIGECKRLYYLDLGVNRFGGTIPREIFQLSALTYLYFHGNKLSGSLPPEISKMKHLEELFVSDNNLSGHIPKDIEGCYSLKTLVMARNKLNGSIPNRIGDLASLETLDLSSNNLSGPIPETLEKLEYMVKLNLSFNHLEGEIPMKGVFMNLSQVDVRGNNKLCGLNMEIVQKLGVFYCVGGKKKRNIVLPIILSVIGAVVLFILMLCLLWMIISQKKKLKEGKTSLSSTTPLKGLPQNISYGDIRVATNDFAAENLIGKGGFGYVYKGAFSISTSESETTTFAVKVLDLQQSKASQSFIAECEALKNIRHRNLVKVITTCCSVDYKGDEFKAIVVQFMPNGNLDMSLYPKEGETGSYLTLLQRLNIAIDVASALDYLHHDCDPPLVHCDLKPANVLLDENMVAHVADFGLARFLSQNPSENQSSTLELKGSIGYIAPEYGLGGKASTCGDVFSFGIMLLEMFIGKKPTDEMFKEGLSLNKFVSSMDEDQVLKVADQRLIDDYESSTQNSHTNSHSDNLDINGKTHWTLKAEECIAAVIRLGLSCAAQQPKDRLTMRDASIKLKGIRQSMLGL